MEAVELAPNEKRCTKCKEVKDRSEFSHDRGKKDYLSGQCKSCSRIYKESKYQTEINLPNGDLIKCPYCPLSFRSLAIHSAKAHGLDKANLKTLGVAETNTALSTKNRSIARVGRPNHKLRKGDYAELCNNCFTFPKDFWPKDCRYAKVKIDESKFKISFNPTSKILDDTKTVTDQGDKSARYRITMHHDLIASLQLVRPIYKLREGAGFFIDFEGEDKALFYSFAVWAKSGYSMKNLSQLSIICNNNERYITVSGVIWPFNAEYAYCEWTPSKRKNVPNYLDVFPVTKTGQISGGADKDLKQYIGTDVCLKVTRASNRFYFTAKGFIKNNNLSPSDWDLKEVLPSGALRFRLYKEREPKQQQEAS